MHEKSDWKTEHLQSDTKKAFILLFLHDVLKWEHLISSLFVFHLFLKQYFVLAWTHHHSTAQHSRCHCLVNWKRKKWGKKRRKINHRNICLLLIIFLVFFFIFILKQNTEIKKIGQINGKCKRFFNEILPG